MMEQFNKASGAVVKAVGFCVCIGLGFYLRAMVLAYGWNRFAVEGLGAPVLSPSMAFGLAVLATVMVRPAPDDTNGQDAPEWPTVIVRALVLPLVAWVTLALVWEIAR